MARVKCLVIAFHLLVLFLGFLSSKSSADENLAPIDSPPPSKSPIGSPPPSKSPAPTYNVSVQGHVFCNCTFVAYSKSSIPHPRLPIHYSPLPGAGVHLKCRSLVVSKGTTGANGGFKLKAQFPQVADWQAMNRFVGKRCKVYVASTPVPACTVPESLGPAGGVHSKYKKGAEDGLGYIAFFRANDLHVGQDGCHKE